MAGKPWPVDDPRRALMSERAKKLNAEGANRTQHGLARTPTYNSWRAMLLRCYKPDNKDYANYGGRGITVCERWRVDLRNFLADMGEKPEGASIERIDVNGNYEPSNCTWLPKRYQSKNRRPWKHSPEGMAAIIAARKASTGTRKHSPESIEKMRLAAIQREARHKAERAEYPPRGSAPHH